MALQRTYHYPRSNSFKCHKFSYKDRFVYWCISGIHRNQSRAVYMSRDESNAARRARAPCYDVGLYARLVSRARRILRAHVYCARRNNSNVVTAPCHQNSIHSLMFHRQSRENSKITCEITFLFRTKPVQIHQTYFSPSSLFGARIIRARANTSGSRD